MSPATPWEEYLARLCLDTWSLDPASTLQVMKHLEALAAPGVVTASAVATVLQRAGVGATTADVVAPVICAAVAS